MRSTNGINRIIWFSGRRHRYAPRALQESPCQHCGAPVSPERLLAIAEAAERGWQAKRERDGARRT